MANAVGDVWKCGVEWREGIENGMIVIHREVSSVLDTDENVLGAALTADLVTLGDAISTAMLGNGAHLVCATAQRVNLANPTRIYTSFSSLAPIVSDTVMPAQSAILMSVYPDPGGLIKSGRSYIPFIDESNQDGGQILASVRTAIETALEPLLLDLIEVTGAADLKAVLWRKIGELSVDIKTAVLRPVMANQRRRMKPHQIFK